MSPQNKQFDRLAFIYDAANDLFNALRESKSTFDVRVIIGVPTGCDSVECMFAKTAMDAP